MRLKIGKNLRAAILNTKFSGSYKKRSVVAAITTAAGNSLLTVATETGKGLQEFE